MDNEIIMQIAKPFIILTVAALIFKTIMEILTAKIKSKNNTSSNNTASSDEGINYKDYERGLLLTKNEYSFYKNTLKPIADKYNLYILSKVRIEDLIKVKSGLDEKHTQTARNYIKSRHFDFVLADPDNLYIYAVMELDDSSHQRADTKETDKMKNELCEFVELPIIRTNGKDTQTLENQIEDILKARKN